MKPSGSETSRPGRSTVSYLVAIALVVAGLVGAGCRSWAWRVPGLRYPPTKTEILAFDSLPAARAALDQAGWFPEAYAIGSLEAEDRSLDALRDQLGAEAGRRGASAVVLVDIEHVTSLWTRTREASSGSSPGVHRQESIQEAASTVHVRATGLRNPEFCIGATLDCESIEASDTCDTRVRDVVPGGPADKSGLVSGNLIIQADSVPVSHPWDVYQRADRKGVEGRELCVLREGAQGSGKIQLQPRPCDELYSR